MKAPQVIVVEDDFGVPNGTVEALKLEGFDVTRARGTAEAMEALEGGCRPCVVLLDLKMPTASGESPLPRIREHLALQGVPIVAMSASDRGLQEASGQWDARLARPLDVDSLYELLGRLCTHSVSARAALGFRSLDVEHEIQLRIANALVKALGSRGDRKLAARDLEELVDFTRSHFAYETEIMGRYEYPEAAHHEREHELWLAEANNLEEASSAGRSPLTLGGAVAVWDSIVSHIETMDQAFATYLSARAYAR